jgi:hypothetical protein
MKITLFVILLYGMVLIPVGGQKDDEGFTRALNNINQSVLQAQLGFLASDWTEGREAGKRGEFLAGDYIASMLQLYGVKPGGDYSGGKSSSAIFPDNERTYFQNFNLVKTSAGDIQSLELSTVEGEAVSSVSFVFNTDYRIKPTDKNIEITAPVIFVGFGFKNEKLLHDDYSKLDLKGKFILRISGFPGFASNKLSLSELSASSGEFERMAKKSGALGIIEFNPDLSFVETQPQQEFMNMSPAENPGVERLATAYSLPYKTMRDDLLQITISSKIANAIMNDVGFVLDDYIKKSESGSVKQLPVIKNKFIHLKTTVKTETVRVRNVIGIIEGKDPDQIILAGAHYDHMGIQKGFIWNGADDNGSGTVGVMTVAKAIMETGLKPKKTILIALWTAEEEGLLGSKHYVENLPYPLSNLRLYVNSDMISRYMSESIPNNVEMAYTESNTLLRSITEKNLINYGIDLDVDYQPSKEPTGGSDHRSFVGIGVPVMRIKAGHREQYHTPYDEINTVDWDIMEKIVKLNFINIWELANTNW